MDMVSKFFLRLSSDSQQEISEEGNIRGEGVLHRY